MPTRRSTYFVTIFVMAMGFLLLSLFVYYSPNSPLDLEITKEIQEHHNPFLDGLMRAVSWFGYMPVSGTVVIGTALLFFIFRNRKEGIFILLTMLSGVVSSTLKVIVNRPRPTEDLVRIISKAKHQSFPSGHVLFYVAFFGMLFLIMRHHKDYSPIIRLPVSVLSLVLIFTVPFSRIYLGAHWFTDVTAGFIAGLFFLAILGYFYLFKKEPLTPVAN